MKKQQHNTQKKSSQENSKRAITYPRPAWVPHSVTSEAELCPDCFKVVGDKSRYTLVCLLGKMPGGASVGTLTDLIKLKQPTVTHHLQTLLSVDAVECERVGRQQIYRLNRKAHCFEECKIPF